MRLDLPLLIAYFGTGGRIDGLMSPNRASFTPVLRRRLVAADRNVAKSGSNFVFYFYFYFFSAVDEPVI